MKITIMVSMISLWVSACSTVEVSTSIKNQHYQLIDANQSLPLASALDVGNLFPEQKLYTLSKDLDTYEQDAEQRIVAAEKRLGDYAGFLGFGCGLHLGSMVDLENAIHFSVSSVSERWIPIEGKTKKVVFYSVN